MNKVYRTQQVEGMEIPGIIHNSSYFLVQLSVYEDGVVGCWHKSDLEQFREDLRKGWVVPAVPIGESLSIHHLGSFPIVDAHWCHDTKGFHRYVSDCVKKLNPEMKNLWRATPRELEKWDKHRVSWSATATPCKLTSELGYNLADGASCNLFYRKNETLFLTTLTAYNDKSLSIGQGGERFYTLVEINAMFADGTLCTQPQEQEWVTVDGLGKLLFGTPNYIVDVVEKQKMVSELLKKVADEQTAQDLCIEAYYEYLTYPGDWSREELRKAYEAVPEHERIYLGDMDSRDSDFQRILYEPERKREV